MIYEFGKNLRYSEYFSEDNGYCVYDIYGEDPNCDLGGHHSNPYLGCAEGTFKDVLEYAANNIGGFYTWGGGGYIRSGNSKNKKPIILDNSKRIKIERKKKITNITKGNIDYLIDNIDFMTIDEIKQSLKQIKKHI